MWFLWCQNGLKYVFDRAPYSAGGGHSTPPGLLAALRGLITCKGRGWRGKERHRKKGKRDRSGESMRRGSVKGGKRKKRWP